MLQPIQNRVIIKTYDKDGIEIPEQTQYVYNSPWGEYDFLKDEPVITIQWDGLGINEESKAEMDKPVQVAGRNFYGYWAWGSGVKMGRTTGLTRDLGGESGLIRFAEDTYRFNRALLPNSAGGVRGRLRVQMKNIGALLTLADGSQVKIEDGFGYIRKSVADVAESRLAFSKVKYGEWDTSYTYLQRFEGTEAFYAEFEDEMRQNLITLNDPTAFAFSSACDVGFKEQFLRAAYDKDRALFDDLYAHPYLATSFAQSWSRAAFKLATTGGQKMIGGLFAPTTSDKLVLPSASGRFPQSDEYLITRYPIDAPSSIQAVQVEQSGGEADRIANMVVLQYTLTNQLANSFKGCLGVIPDELWPFDADLIVSTEDEKLNAAWLTEDDVTAAKETERWYVFEDACLCIPQWFEAGSAIGVPSELARLLGGDYDGDSGAVEPGVKYPERIRQAKQFPQIPNPKLKKVKTPIKAGDKRTLVALKSMANIVGHATNITSTVLAYPDQEYLALALGYETADKLHFNLMRAIKLGTDIFKTSEDYEPVVKMLSSLAKALRDRGIRAPWTGWARDEIAFVNSLPKVFEDDDQYLLADEWDQKHGIVPETTGTVARIARFVLKNIELPPTVTIQPLANYRDWARLPEERYANLAARLLQAYGLRVKALNVQMKDEWEAFVARWQEMLGELINQQRLDANQLAGALWYVAHDNQRHSQLHKVASAPFLGFPEQTTELILNRPGLSSLASSVEPVEIVVVGLQYQLPTAEDYLNKPLVIQVQDIIQAKGNNRIARQVLVSPEPLAGQVAPKDEQYPGGMLGLTELGVARLLPGLYAASLRLDGKKWMARLQRQAQA